MPAAISGSRNTATLACCGSASPSTTASPPAPFLGNPYLAGPAILAAGLDGIESGLDPGDPNSENLYEIPYAELRSRGLETLPSNLLDATEELEGDEALRAAFDAAAGRLAAD